MSTEALSLQNISGTYGYVEWRKGGTELNLFIQGVEISGISKGKDDNVQEGRLSLLTGSGIKWFVI